MSAPRYEIVTGGYIVRVVKVTSPYYSKPRDSRTVIGQVKA